MLVAILEAVPNEHVSRKALLSAGVSALRTRLRDATSVRPSRTVLHTLSREQKPGLLRDCAKAVGVKLKVKSLYKSQEQVRAEILQAVEAHISDLLPVRDNTTKAQLLKAGRCQVQSTIKDLSLEDLQKYSTALNIPYGSETHCRSRDDDGAPPNLDNLRVAILRAVPNERVSKEALIADGVLALAERLQDGSLERQSSRMAYALLHEQKPGLLRDCARAMWVPLHSRGHRSAHKTHQQVRDDILQAVEAHISKCIEWLMRTLHD